MPRVSLPCWFPCHRLPRQTNSIACLALRNRIGKPQTRTQSYPRSAPRHSSSAWQRSQTNRNRERASKGLRQRRQRRRMISSRVRPALRPKKRTRMAIARAATALIVRPSARATSSLVQPLAAICRRRASSSTDQFGNRLVSIPFSCSPFRSISDPIGQAGGGLVSRHRTGLCDKFMGGQYYGHFGHTSTLN